MLLRYCKKRNPLPVALCWFVSNRRRCLLSLSCKGCLCHPTNNCTYWESGRVSQWSSMLKYWGRGGGDSSAFLSLPQAVPDSLGTLLWRGPLSCDPTMGSTWCLFRASQAHQAPVLSRLLTLDFPCLTWGCKSLTQLHRLRKSNRRLKWLVYKSYGHSTSKYTTLLG